MNFTDFNTSPAGFPLEADATLGFTQSNLLDGILGLAKMMGESLAGVILSGCTIVGSTMTDGWILYDGEVLFFEGGTVQSTWIIEETTVSKNNQDGTSVPRYYTRKAKFGSGSGSISFNFTRVGTIADQAQNAASMAAAGDYQGSAQWVIFQGLNPVSAGAGGITSGRAFYGSQLVKVNSYGSAVSSGSPVYLMPDGTWTTVSGGSGALQFNPYTNKHLRTFYRKRMHPLGSILWWKNGVAELTTFFPGSGLGLTEWDGFAIANGSNGTLNLSAAIAGLTAIQRI